MAYANAITESSEQMSASETTSGNSTPTDAARAARQSRPSEVSREALYELVWTDPLLRIGSRFGVTATYLARVCDELRVPRPPNGYWAQVEFGKAPPKPPLPAVRAGEQTAWKPGTAVTSGRKLTLAEDRLKSETSTKAGRGNEEVEVQ